MESKIRVNELKWNSNQIITFLKMYRKHDCLWDASSPRYLKRDIKNSALESLVNELIVDGFEITLPQLKSKIKSLRDTYRNELNKINKSKKSGTAAKDLYKPKLAWFPMANSFLRGIFMGRNSSSNLDLDTAQESCRTEDWDNDSPELQVHQSLEDLEMSTTSSFSNSQTKVVSSVFQHKKRSPEIAPPNCQQLKFSRTERGKAASTRLETTISKLHKVARLATYVPEDQYDKFGTHIAAQLRELPLRSFLILQGQIQDIITTERLSCLNDLVSPRPQSCFSNSSQDM